MKICEKMCGKDDMKIFEGIIADEHKHAQLFRTIYRNNRPCAAGSMQIRLMLPNHAAKGSRRQFLMN